MLRTLYVLLFESRRRPAVAIIGWGALVALGGFLAWLMPVGGASLLLIVSFLLGLRVGQRRGTIDPLGRGDPLPPDQNGEPSEGSRPLGIVELDSPKAEETMQWICRTAEADGSERVEGMVRADLDSGQTQTAVHVPFHPPLRSPVHCSSEVLKGQQVRARIALAQPFGIRIDVRRSGPSVDPAVVEIGFRVAAEVRSRAA